MADPKMLIVHLTEMHANGLLTPQQYLQGITAVSNGHLGDFVKDLRLECVMQLSDGRISSTKWVACNHGLDSLTRPCKLCQKGVCPWS